VSSRWMSTLSRFRVADIASSSHQDWTVPQKLRTAINGSSWIKGEDALLEAVISVVQQVEARSSVVAGWRYRDASICQFMDDRLPFLRLPLPYNEARFIYVFFYYPHHNSLNLPPLCRPPSLCGHATRAIVNSKPPTNSASKESPLLGPPRGAHGGAP